LRVFPVESDAGANCGVLTLMGWLCREIDNVRIQLYWTVRFADCSV